MKRLGIYCVLSGCFLFAAIGSAQVITGTIQGTVKDQSGAVLPGAKITIQDTDTGVSHDTVADATGHYLMSSLPVGHYQVTGSMTGFQNEARSGITLAVGENAVIDLQLPVGAVAQTVEVTGEAPLVQTTDATVSSLVNETSITSLPLNGRDLSQLILLNPSVNYSPNSITSETQAFNGFGKRYSISGQRGEDNEFILDGELIADYKRHIPAGPDGNLLGVETSDEFQVITSDPPAQYGRFLGGVFNAVSKSGTNQFHGDLYDFLRNSDMDSRSFTDPSTGPPPLRRNQFGGTLGGPIQKDKTFFFIGFEGSRETNDITATDIVPTAAARAGILPTGDVTVSPLIQPYLALYPLPTPGAPTFPAVGTADYIYQNNKTYSDNFGLVRLDHQFSDKDSLFVRYTGSNSNDLFTLYPNGTGNYGPLNQTSALGTDLFVLGETHIFSPSMLNTAHLSFSRVTPLDLALYPTVPANVIGNANQLAPSELAAGSGITSEAGFDTSPARFYSNRWNVSDDVSKTIGAHQFQFGGMVEYMQLNSELTDRAMGVWTFSDLTEFLEAVPETYRGSPPPYGTYARYPRQDFFGLYGQDTWRATSRLTVTLGVRWEPYTVPNFENNLISNLDYVNQTTGTVGNPLFLNKSWTNFEPRVGLAWSPTASGKTSVRAGFALLYEPNDANQYYSMDDRQPPLAYDFTLPQTATADYFPSGQAAIAASTTLGPAYSTPYANNVSPSVLQSNFTVQQQVGANNMISVGYVGTFGSHELSVANVNVPNPVYDGTSLAMPVGATVQNPAWSQIVFFGNNSSSSYNALDVSVQRRFSHGIQAQLSYTWQKNEDEADSGQTAGGVTTGGGYVKIPNNMQADWGLSGYDIPQVLTANYSWDLPPAPFKGFIGKALSGWQLSGLWTIESGQPLSVLQAVSTTLNSVTEENTSPNAAPCSQLVLGGTSEYFNLSCFTPAGTRELGNVGRNSLLGPGLVDWDPGLFKNQPIRENMNLQIRLEVFNVLNRSDYGAPASTVFTGTGAPESGAGQITSYILPGRELQVSLKLLF